MRTERKTRNPSQGTKYEMSTKNYTQTMDIWKQRPAHTYIYVLFFTNKIKGLKSTPFSVGQAKDLATAFKSHPELIWHLARFRQKAIVHVIASVPDWLADESEQQTVEGLLKYEIRLNNIPSQNKVSTMSDIELKEYTSQLLLEKVFHSFHDLNKQWAKKVSEFQAQTNRTAKLEGKITSAELYRAVAKKKYPHSQAHSLSKLLAKKYNPKTNTAVHVFETSSLPEVEQVEFVKNIIIAMQGDWHLAGENVRLNHPLTFTPSQGLELNQPQKANYGRRPETVKEIKAEMPRTQTVKKKMKAQNEEKSTEA